MHAFHLQNRTVSEVVDGKTPFELFFKWKPDTGHVQVFESKSYLHSHKMQGTGKLVDYSSRSIYVGARNMLYGVYFPDESQI